MIKKVKGEEVSGEGFVGLLDENIILFCANYIYSGVLSGVSEEFVQLSSPRIVYETGAFSDKKFKDAQALPFDIYIQKGAVESFGKTNKE